ncbi:MAG: acyltransferase [Opitutaceae bacterium]|nr:acyltransferase [Opitutaceae bacterium]
MNSQLHPKSREDAAGVQTANRPIGRKIPPLGLMVAGIILFGIAVVLAVADYRSSGRSDDVVFARTLTNADYAAPFETEAITFDRNQLTTRIRVSAPLDNSWMDVTVVAVSHGGQEAARTVIRLAYYHGFTDGRWWWTGRGKDTQFLTLPAAENYRFRVSVRAGAGANTVADPSRIAEPLVLEILRGGTRATRLRLLGSMVLAFFGVGLALRGAAKSRSDAPRPQSSPSLVVPAKGVARGKVGDRMVFIDGLRGIACLGVLGCHLFVPELSTIAPPLAEALPAAVAWAAHHGHLGVEIFFVLSGFVIAYSLHRHRINGSLALRFVLRRSVRLDPPYLVALVVSGGIAALSYPDSLREVVFWLGGAPGVWANAFYLQDLLRFRAMISVAWTLCLEIQFYLAYFVLLWMAQRLARATPATVAAPPRRVDALCMLALAAPLLIWSFSTWYPDARNLSFAGTWFRFFLGALALWATQSRLVRPVFLGVAGCVGMASALTGDARGGVAVATAVLILFACETGRSTRWLAGRVWQYFGRISYSLYLAHVVVGLPLMNWIWGAVPHSPAWAGLMAVVGIAASLGAAALLHRLIEAPALRLSQRIRYS